MLAVHTVCTLSQEEFGYTRTKINSIYSKNKMKNRPKANLTNFNKPSVIYIIIFCLCRMIDFLLHYCGIIWRQQRGQFDTKKKKERLVNQFEIFLCSTAGENLKTDVQDKLVEFCFPQKLLLSVLTSIRSTVLGVLYVRALCVQPSPQFQTYY